jgi:hypothetical protein
MYETRFALDEKNMVVDTLALYVFESFDSCENLTDPIFSFHANRVFKEYLVKSNIPNNQLYEPIDVAKLMQEPDSDSYSYLKTVWLPRYENIRVFSGVSFNKSNRHLYKGTAFFLGEKSGTVLSQVTSDSLTLAALLAMSKLALDVSTILRTRQYRNALAQRHDPRF